MTLLSNPDGNDVTQASFATLNQKMMHLRQASFWAAQNNPLLESSLGCDVHNNSWLWLWGCFHGRGRWQHRHFANFGSMATGFPNARAIRLVHIFPDNMMLPFSTL